MHRKLAAESTSFTAIVDAVRCDLAQRYVEDTERPLTDVAALLGFSAPSAFSRWHATRAGNERGRRRASVRAARA